MMEKWVKLYDWEACVDESGSILRGTKGSGLSITTAYPYTYDHKQKVWKNAKGININYFRKLYRLGNAKMM